MEYLKLGVILLLLDAIYLSTFGNQFKTMISNIQNNKVTIRYGSVIVCYILIVYMLKYFIIEPKRSVKDAFVLGVCSYGIFDTVNYALFNKYKLSLAILDTLWGGTLYAATTLIYKRIS